MFISAEKIIELIQAANDCEEKLPEAEQWIHVSDIATTLQKLIDDEEARLEKMADDFELEALEVQRLEFENEAAGDREVDFNWPHGV